jgi:2-polyprenyl-3-methyl-5-hydroxy-6-metoxy-1,4-benzoquinol methylase
MRETPDVETSSRAYARRFAGKVGAWFLAVQLRAVRKLLAPFGPGATLVDVGGGHGQLATPLAACGYEVTVLGSHPSCGELVTSG